MACDLKAFGLVLSAVLLAPFGYGQSAAIAVDRTQYFTQTSEASPEAAALPFSFNFNIRGGAIDMSGWAPAFYKPGSGAVPQTGASADTNTGTLNFPAAPNNGGDYMFVHDFASAAELEAYYPNGDYGILFQGAGAPTPASFTAGLQFASTVYPGTTPRVTSVDNGAVWAGNSLILAPSGVTTLTLNTFPEYASTTYGAVIGVGIYVAGTGNVVSTASLESYDLPLGDSTATPTPHHDPAITQFTIDSSWLTPGVAYNIEIHYTVIADRPEEANLNGIEWQGVASARKITTITVMVPGTGSNDFNADGKADLVWRNTASGAVGFWLMNGTDMAEARANITVADQNWQIVAHGDFNADGQTDLVWRNLATGAVGFWLMNGTDLVEPRAEYTVGDQNWKIVGAGDFNDDGRTDLVWQNSATGTLSFWLMDGTTRTEIRETVTVSDTNWKIAGAGDFNGDGQVDLVWRNAATGSVGFWLMSGTDLVEPRANVTVDDQNWKIVGTGDYNNDGQTDLVWRNTATGAVGFWLMAGTTISEARANVTVSDQDWKIQ